MYKEIITDHAKFFTATIFEWKPLLVNESFKKIIINSLDFLVTNQRVFIFGFVLMDNHIHLIWQARSPHIYQNIQRDFLKYTAQMMKFKLKEMNPECLEEYRVGLSDREYQIWQRNPMSTDLFSNKVVEQKLLYIHENPVRAGMTRHSTDYRYSSAGFYYKEQSHFSFLSDYRG